MRILHVLPGLAPGGMERLVIQLAEDTGRHGDSVAVASGPGSWASKVTQAGASHLELPATSRTTAVAMAAATARLARYIRHLRPDLIHAHNVRAAALARAALAMTRHRAALLPTLHGLAPGDYRMATVVLRRAAARVIACAPSVARSLAATGFPGDRIDVIANGAALAPASRQRMDQLRRALRLGDGPLVVGIGRLAEQKNWPDLIAAASLLDGPTYAVAGDGPLRGELEALAQRSGGRVRFLGPVDDIAALAGLADCVVSTSTWEGLPLSLLEVLSLGVPVVATAVDGVADIVPPQAAVLVRPAEPAAVSAAISSVLGDEQLAESLRRNAMAASAAWRPEQMLTRYRNAYHAALSAANGSHAAG